MFLCRTDNTSSPFPDVYNETFHGVGVSSRAHLSEAFQVKYEDVGQRPQTQLDAALLQLLTVGTSPGVIRSQLQGRGEESDF